MFIPLLQEQVKKMRQKVNVSVPITRDSSSQESEIDHAPALFHKNQNSALCLPLLSEEKKIIWVHSAELKIPEDKVSKLDEAFNRIPYLTQKQTLSLAQHCSLHPDQVRVWFMVQRLLYGISWDAKDIHKVRRQLLGGTTSKKQHKNEKETKSKPKLSGEDENDTKEGIASTSAVKWKKLGNASADGPMIAENKPRRGRKRKALKSEEKSDVIMKTTAHASWNEEETARIYVPIKYEASSGSCLKSKGVILQKN